MLARGKGSLSLFPGLEAPQGPWGWERLLWEEGYTQVAGVDEAGRGPLAGPVVAAAVILGAEADLPLVGDSKQIDAERREKAFRLIMRRSRAVGLGLVGPEEIDRTNILQASLAAMAQAVACLNPQPDCLLVDGRESLPSGLPQRPLVKGDARSVSIGAASIVAKVIRDRLMLAYDRLFPQYGFASHKGYGTKLHLAALDCHGPCRLHRRSFHPVASSERT